MVHLVAMVANDADRMPSLLYALRNELHVPEAGSEPETWGVGYYAEERALIIRKPAELLQTRTVFELAPTVQSSVVVACVLRDGTARDSAPPHRFRSWLFGYSGDLSLLTPLEPRIVDRLPDFVQSELPDATAGTLAFGMFIAELHRASLLDDALASNEAFAQALNRTVEAIRMLTTEAGVPAPRAVYTATNGRVILAARAGVPLYRKVQEGLEPSPGPVESTLGDFKRVAEALKRFRAVILTGEVSPGRTGWTEVPDGATVWVDRKLTFRTL